MSEPSPVDLLFGGMGKLGPGSDADTLHVLGMLPAKSFGVVVNAGCGSGRETLVLARELDVVVDAVDSHEPFLALLRRRVAEAGLGDRVRTHCMDMRDIPAVFRHVGLLWSEGAAYNIGFAAALRRWKECMVPGGFVVVSELSWLGADAPAPVREFFRTGYPAMQDVAGNIAAAEAAGYAVLDTHVLPDAAWVEDYYEVLEPRARQLAGHESEAVRQFAHEMLVEIETFALNNGSYGYVFYVLQPM